MRSSKRLATTSILMLALATGCPTARGPVDRSVDAAHATNRTIGETVDSATDVPSEPGNAFVDILTAPFRLGGRLLEAQFGP